MENILVVEKTILEAAGFADKPGFFTGDSSVVLRAVRDRHIFMRRDLCETDYDYKQIIPYTVVRHGNSYLLMKRLPKQGETRLHGLLSIGVGGHINDTEDGGDIILSGALRELAEEVYVPHAGQPVFMGLLNDSDTDVGRVHLGAVYLLEADGGNFEVNEKDKMEARWATAGELQTLTDAMEGWSRILMESGFIC